jgi:hypothetical protein
VTFLDASGIAAFEAEKRASRQQALERLAEFRRRTGGRGSGSAAELLNESRASRVESLMGAPTPPGSE